MGAKVLDFFGFHCPAAPNAVHILNPAHWFEMWDRAASLGLYSGMLIGSFVTVLLVAMLFGSAWFITSLVRGSR